MKITFEDEGAQLEVELPNINVRQQYKSIKGMSCPYMDAELDILSKLENALKEALNGKHTVSEYSPTLLRLVVLFLSQIDPGTPAKLDVIASKVFRTSI